METVTRWFKVLYKGWMKVAHFIGRVNTTILLTLFYFVFLGIAKLAIVISGKDLLDSRLGDRPSYWKERKDFKVDKKAFLKPY